MEPDVIMMFTAAFCAAEKVRLPSAETPETCAAAEVLRQLGSRVNRLKSGGCNVFPCRKPVRRPALELDTADRSLFLFLAGFTTAAGGDLLVKQPAFSLTARDCDALAAAADKTAVFGFSGGKALAASAVFGRRRVFRIPQAQDPCFTMGLAVGALTLSAGADLHFPTPEIPEAVLRALRLLAEGGAQVETLTDGARVRKGTPVCS